MDDVYCPICRLVVERRGSGCSTAPRHCPRCLARGSRLVTMLELDRLPQPPEQNGHHGGNHHHHRQILQKYFRAHGR